MVAITETPGWAAFVLIALAVSPGIAFWYFYIWKDGKK